MHLAKILAVLALSFFTATSQAVEVRKFDDPELQTRFQDLTYELRCLVCQNQNIADSNAELAQDLRREVDRMLREGQTDDQIADFMVARYGEFVLYRPRFRPGTALLWLGPFALALIGLVFLGFQIKRARARAGSAVAMDDAELARVEALLADVGGSGISGAKETKT